MLTMSYKLGGSQVKRNRNLSPSNISDARGIYRATVTSVSTDNDTVSVKIPRLSNNIVYDQVPFYGDKPAVDDEIVVGFLEGQSNTPVALVLTGKASTLTGGGGSSVGGANTQVQYNNSGVLAGSANMTFDGTSLNVAGLKLASTAITSTAAELNILDGVTSNAAELNLLDGITAGTVSASLAVIVDSNKDITGFRNVTLTGELDAATLDISGDADIDGTTNLDVVNIDGETTITHSTGNYVLMAGNANEQIKLVSDNNSGRPYIAFHNQDASGNLDRKGYIGFPQAASDTSRIYIRADQGVIDMSATEMTSLTLSGNADFNGDLDVDGTANLDVVDIDGAVDMASTLTVNSHTFLADHVQTGRTSFVVEPWNSATIALGNFGSVGTQGSYRTALAWNYERDANSNFTHLNVNSYAQAGDFSIGNTGFLFNYDTDYASAHTTNPTAVASVLTDGQIHAIKGGADGGIVLGQTFSTGYVGLRTANMSSTGSEYIIMSSGGHTLISAGTGGSVYIRANANDATNELLIGNGTLNIDFDDYVKWETPLPVVTSYSTLRRGETSGGTLLVVGYDGSSRRYKENITNFVKSDWENIYNLQAVRFTWKEEVAEDKHASWGLISEDVYAQIPELGVMRVVEGVNDGNPVPDTVNYEQLCVFLIEAVKDLNTRLAALE